MAGRSAQSFPTRHTLEMQELAGSYRLGAPVTEYRGGFTQGETTAVNLVVVFIGVICFATVWFSLKLTPVSQSLGFVLAILFMGLLAIVAKVLTTLFRPRRSWRVYIFTDGFIFMREGQSDIVRWEEVQAIWHQIERHRYGEYGGYTIHIYTVICADGRRTVFDDKIKKVEKLGNLLNEQIANALWPRVFADYQAGRVIPFGLLSVSQQGISNGKELLPWSAIKEIKFDREDVKVHQKGRLFNWGKVSIEEIPNLFLLKALTRSVLGK